ncbi:universal stress protein [Idiomarina seosinensis]|uniref:Universal stress protein UspA n=1 Tax=Idiomarina seosinensis TaxID=281739 RepID=A0A432ZJI8_9GAMM|nr:universal stress protein [Idiomarina seosinensis]RUO77990.1 universal stress protein UspA [Idiomarina seosinensis]
MSNVIACIDGSSAANGVVESAAWAASQMSAPLTLLHVIEEGHAAARQDMTGNIGLGSREKLLDELAELDARKSKLLLEHGHQLLEQAKQKALQQDNVTDVSMRQRHGELVESLLKLEPETRLLVLGLHGEDHSDGSHIGSQLETVLRRVHKPIMLCPDQFKAPQSAMLAYDASNSTKKSVELLANSPLFSRMPVHVVMVGADSETNQAELDWARKTLEQGGHDVETAIVAGDVEPALHQYQDQHDIGVMIMGAYGHSKIRQFLVGSTTTNMLEASKTPLLILR